MSGCLNNRPDLVFEEARRVYYKDSQTATKGAEK
jgi:hypothetical protein